jgi:adenylate cyclase
MDSQPDQKLVINGVIADFGRETLRTKSGQLVGLRPQAFSVLRYLVEHATRVVTKNELMQAVWPGIAVTDDSLVQCIHEIRRALHDEQRVILKTVQGRGYRLVLAVGNSDDAERDWPLGEPQRVGEPSVAILLNGISSQQKVAERTKLAIAVMPFVNMSSDSEQQYVSDGITEDIVTALSRWQSLAIASRCATARLKTHPFDISTVRRELGVDFLVEGSVRRMGDRIRITAQLTDAKTGSHIWAERFDHPRTDFFVVQDEVVRTIVGTLVDRVYESTAEHMLRKPPSSRDAYGLAMQANWLHWDKPDARAEAKRCLERAIELDPGYAVPYSLLAVMLRHDWHRGLAGSHDVLEHAFALAKRGVELASHESTSHMALSLVMLERHSFDLSLYHMERAIEMNPANPWHQADFGMLLSRIGRAEEGLARLRDARRIDPFFEPSWYGPVLGMVQFGLRRYEDAMLEFDRGALSSADAIAVMAGCCAKLGNSQRARVLVARCLAVQPEATVGIIVARTVFKDVDESEHLADCLRLAGFPE